MNRLAICCISAFLIGLNQAYGAGKVDGRRSNRVTYRVKYGLASWYGGRNQGRLMACGERFNKYKMVAANRSLPLGTRVKVTNLRNGRSVVVRIMDRGPYVAGRVIDLSKAAANRLRFTHRGLTPVRIRVLSTPHRPRENQVARTSRMPSSAESGPAVSSRE
jgi:rare lipoprotein A